MADYVKGHFGIITNTEALLSPNLPWRVRQAAFNRVFPPEPSNIVVVIDGQTPELSETAAAALAADLAKQPTLFHSVQRPGNGPFWKHNRLLFASTSDVKAVTAQLMRAQPFLGSMASDPSLRGLANTLSLTLEGVKPGQPTPPELRAPIRALAEALSAQAAGKPAFFSWQTLILGHKPDEREMRQLILVGPATDFSRLEAGEAPIHAIRAAAQRLQLDNAHGVRIRLTGVVPLQDEEFATLKQGLGLIACLASAAIVLMLWFAVRSPWLIASILATTLVGLLSAAALGLALFGRFNVISVAFIPLFIGIGMDFGIQFSVRYRVERLARLDVAPAVVATADTMGKSLTVAAASIGAGFLAFAPTSYYGVAQLGVIAGLGMLIALTLNLTLLPALIGISQPPGAPHREAGVLLIMLDSYVGQHRRVVLAAALLCALISAALVPLLRFDFNPMHLRSPRVESVATLVDLMHDPDLSPNTLEVIRPSLAAADRLAEVFRADPTVYSARTLSSFVPAGQPEKIAVIADAADLLDFTLNPVEVAPAPTDAQVIASLTAAATKLRRASVADPELRADAQRLADQFDTLAGESAPARAGAEQLLIPGFVADLEEMRSSLHPYAVSIATLPPELVRQWQTPNGRARISVVPKGASNDNAVLRRFVRAGTRIAPDAVGTAIYLQAYGRAVVGAFLEAGVLSFVVIFGLLLITLRRVRDVAITMAPIVLTGLLTMGTCVLIGQQLNFANIIALPLLFGIGVAFDIYFVMAWRAGGSHLLTSSLARGVFFSALATATGFGSLWASSHPGTASMGKLLMISLLWTLASVLLFQPALMAMPSLKAESAATAS